MHCECVYWVWFDRVYTGATRVYQDIQNSWVMPTLPKESAGGRP